MNEHDSEKIAAMLYKWDIGVHINENVADFTIFNTCAIRENEMRVFGNVGSLKPVKEKMPNIKIALWLHDAAKTYC